MVDDTLLSNAAILRTNAWGAYLRVRNFLLILIGNGDFQQSSSVCTFTAYCHCVHRSAEKAISH